MTETETNRIANHLISTYRDRAFEISMPDQASYDLMRRTLASKGRVSGPDGRFFVIKVEAVTR